MKLSLRLLFLSVLIEGLAYGRTCETSTEIREHVGKKTELGYFTKYGEVISNIDDRFCVHTVKDGTRKLKDGAEITNPNFFVKEGLRVAFSDINKQDHGLTYFKAEKICPQLSLSGASKGSWRAPRSRHGFPEETDRSIEAQSLQNYFNDHDLYSVEKFGQGVFWTGSKDSGIYMWHMNLGSGYTHFAHMDDRNGVLCILIE